MQGRIFKIVVKIKVIIHYLCLLKKNFFFIEYLLYKFFFTFYIYNMLILLLSYIKKIEPIKHQTIIKKFNFFLNNNNNK